MKTIYYLVIFVLISFNSYAQNGTYSWLNPKTSAELFNYIFVSSSKILIAGNAGVLISSSDNGISWNFRKVSDTSFNNVYAIGNSIHIVGGSYDNKSKRLYVRSTDNGVSFSNITSNTIVNPGDTLNLRALFFFDVNTGYIGGASGKMFRTTNGGDNWSAVTTGVTATINRIFFPASASGNIGYAIGGSGSTAFIIKTTDAGLTWNQQTFSITGNQGLAGIHFIDANTGFISGGSNISPLTMALKTTNGGDNWVFQDISGMNPGITYELASIYTFNENIAYAVGSNGKIVRTTDGGTSWQKLFPENNFVYSSGYLTGIGFNGTTGFISGAGGTIIKIQDTSITFLAGQILKHAYDVRFSKTDSLLGFVVGGGQRANASSQIIYYPLLTKTSDGGNTWIDQPTENLNVILNGVEIADNNNIWAVGDSGKVIRTTNAGSNWQIINIGAAPIEKLGDVRFYNSQTGYIGGNGRIFRTTNAGQNWSSSSFTGGTTIHEIDITPNGTVIAATVGAFTQRSTDNGLSWISAAAPNSNYTYNVDFFDDNTGWISGLIGNIAKTTNGGISWTAQTSGIFSSSLDGGIHFWDLNNGAAYGLTGLVLRTTDGGVSWYKTYPFTSQPFRNIYFANNQRGYMVTDLGGIIRYSDFVTNIAQAPLMPYVYSLEQNYPNPFNPSTRINYTISKNTMVTLKIFDILGREVSILVNEVQTPGSYNIDFNASELSSGIYFYKLESGTFTDVKRMVLIK